MKEKISLLKWNSDVAQAPSNEDLLVIYKDETGDNTTYHTVVAWKTHKDNQWISHNEEIFHTILMWSRLPEARDIQILK